MPDMETKKFEIIKKNRKYFAAITKGYKCKILIDSNSENLGPGPVELVVHDISVHTKYGSDLIFKLAADASEQKQAGIVTLRHFRFNSDLVKYCRNLGGKWDEESKTWVFSDIVADKVEELDFIYNSELIPVEIEAVEKIFNYHEAVEYLGYTIAYATGRDSGAKLGDCVSLISGSIDSGGSIKNWGTIVREGSKFRLNVPEKLFERNGNENNWAVTRCHNEINAPDDIIG